MRRSKDDPLKGLSRVKYASLFFFVFLYRWRHSDYLVYHTSQRCRSLENWIPCSRRMFGRSDVDLFLVLIFFAFLMIGFLVYPCLLHFLHDDALLVLTFVRLSRHWYSCVLYKSLISNYITRDDLTAVTRTDILSWRDARTQVLWPSATASKFVSSDITKCFSQNIPSIFYQSADDECSTDQESPFIHSLFIRKQKEI